jgi:hypothetical protein
VRVKKKDLSHSKPNSSKRKPEPEPAKFQDSSLKKDVFGPSRGEDRGVPGFKVLFREEE